MIQLKQLTDFSELGVTTATATHDNGDNTNTAAQRKQKLNKSTTSNFSDDKCNNKHRTSERVSEKKKNQKTKKQRGTQQLQIVCEGVSERDLAAIGLTTKDSPETTNSTERLD